VNTTPGYNKETEKQQQTTNELNTKPRKQQFQPKNSRKALQHRITKTTNKG
jgi:hypothetical protein